MLIKINQTKANFKNEFKIIINDELSYCAKTSWVSRMFKCVMSDLDNNEIMKTTYNTAINLGNAVPFKWIFGKPQISNLCEIIVSEGTKGAFWLETAGFLKSYYVVEYNEMVLKGYEICKGDTSYVSFYDAAKDEQVALLVKPMDVISNKDRYILYILDDVDFDPKVLAFFTIYYDNWNYNHCGEVKYGKEINRGWSYSKYNTKFDPSWRTKHFPPSLGL